MIGTLIVTGSRVSRAAMKKALACNELTSRVQVIDVVLPDRTWRQLHDQTQLLVIQEEDSGPDGAIGPLPGEMAPRIRYRLDRLNLAVQEVIGRLRAVPTGCRMMLPHGGEIGGSSGA